jgi:uncharacterized protein YecT (DUF1311 family)
MKERHNICALVTAVTWRFYGRDFAACRSYQPMIKPISIFLFAFLVNTGSFAQEIACNPGGNTMEMAQCEIEALEQANRVLNETYARLIKRAKTLDSDLDPTESDGAVNRLREAQRAWVAWRDLECPMRSMINRGGSIERILFPACLAQLTDERTKVLEDVEKEFTQ